MLRGGASIAIASMWASMATWSTSTVLFFVLNLMIATIFIASNFKSHNHHPHNLQSQLARSPSFLERVKSVNLSSFYNTAESHDDDHRVQYDSTGYSSPSQLYRAPSLLQRVKSMDFSFNSFYTAPVDQLHEEHQHESEQTNDDSTRHLARVPSILERVMSIKFSAESEQPSNSIGEPSRAHSLLDRVKSFKLPSLLNSDHHSGDTFSNHDQRSDIDLGPHQDPFHDHNVTSNLSNDSGVTPAKKPSTNLTKSHSERRVAESDDDKEEVERRRPETMKASVEVHDESVDARADDFIRRFKQQLKLQRIDSFKKFREMLNGGTSSGWNK